MTIRPPPIPPAETWLPLESKTVPPFEPVSFPTPKEEPPFVAVPDELEDPPPPPEFECPAPPPPLPM